MDQHDWRRAIRLAEELLEQRWDPIGVYHQGDEEQWPPGEYETYAGWLVEELANGAGVTQVADRLRKAQHRMGVDFPDLVDEQMVAAVGHRLDVWSQASERGRRVASSVSPLRCSW